MNLKPLIPTILATVLLMFASLPLCAQQQKGTAPQDTFMVLPFENRSGKAELNWAGEAFAEALPGLLRIDRFHAVSNTERRIIQQSLRIPLSSLPSLAAADKMARTAGATVLVTGQYTEDSVTVSVMRISGGAIDGIESDPKRDAFDFIVSESLGNLLVINGKIAYQVLAKSADKAFGLETDFTQRAATKVPQRAFEAYIKGILVSASDPRSREAYFTNAFRSYGEDKPGEKYSEAALELGHLYLEQRRYLDSLRFFSYVAAESPVYPEAMFYSCLVYFRQSDFDQALEALRPVTERLNLSVVFNTMGGIAIHSARAEKKDKAASTRLLGEGLEFLKKAVKVSPEDSDALFNYGLALMMAEKYPEAVQALAADLRLKPGDGEAQFLLAKALEKTQDPESEEVLKANNKAMELLVADSRYAKLQKDWAAGRVPDSIIVRIFYIPRKDFVMLVEKRDAPGDRSAVEAALVKARELYRQGRDDEALELLKKIVEREPMNAEGYYLIGMIHHRRGQFEDATTNLEAALFWNGNLIEAYMPLIKIFISRRNCQKAETYLKEAKEKAADNEELNALERQLERCSK